jgi:hypothetical protein
MSARTAGVHDDDDGEDRIPGPAAVGQVQRVLGSEERGHGAPAASAIAVLL